MPRTAAPTRQALRHLRHLCTGAEGVRGVTATRAPRDLRSLHTHEGTGIRTRSKNASDQHIALVPATIPSRTTSLATTPSLAGHRTRRSFSTTTPAAAGSARSSARETQGHTTRDQTTSTANATKPSSSQLGPDQDHATSSTASDSSTTPSNQPDITNYYTLFPTTLSAGPPPNGPFHIPLSKLKREFLQLQAHHHPDKYHHSDAAHRTARGMSSLLNTAYKTLSDPLLRARYLLHHNYGVDITSEDNNTHRDLTDQETLMEVLEAQEQIEEATTQEQIDSLKEENKARIKEAERLLGEAFAKEDIELAKRECIRLNYWRSLQQGLHDWEPGKEVRLIH
ncbi:hypothetical protein HRR83_005830 [Exophiala dermatitidis]|uniref:Molecular chaperone HscB n=2 Tax=Exophiala dermatitidis TaxID=5970 RepID=H6BUN7_EXODN|nr:molecular chaperone HscB [Exophiala dermatitidis NIH/UT8656]KAJ4510983.1 hypothetical protein HRR75_005677 [Exophiala dermatitidis]EHY54912.1 molecular chaperone HscB [Exophiala dermatitidis NIH/UT8656]KAJ4513387.1 hypothetical protein HRR74_006199 [Exophiala dermatitidis]KAJ4538061.1 hypothetical protein HRR77_007101 [Exophiala dermatitidis]KAJ4539793.1 hypothetical protein HRR76_003228 [Exophiala dermatitidis]